MLYPSMVSVFRVEYMQLLVKPNTGVPEYLEVISLHVAVYDGGHHKWKHGFGIFYCNLSIG